MQGNIPTMPFPNTEWNPNEVTTPAAAVAHMGKLANALIAKGNDIAALRVIEMRNDLKRQFGIITEDA